jgi:uncharacterized protein (TIGR02172 family)
VHPVELGPQIAVGRTAILYPWGSGQVIKLFHHWRDLDDILFEQKVARVVQSSGLPVPAVGEILQVNGRYGLVYQRMDGCSMWDALARQPWRIFHLTRRTAELHAALHAVAAPVELPDQRQRIQRKIERAGALPEEARQRALAALDKLPGGNKLCHGDFHPGNILMTERGEVIIDWMDTTRGNPLADLARSSILALGAASTAQVPRMGMKVSLRLFHFLYRREYFRLRPGGMSKYRRWLPVVAAARLSENIPELQDWLILRATS